MEMWKESLKPVVLVWESFADRVQLADPRVTEPITSGMIAPEAYILSSQRVERARLAVTM